MDTMRMKAVFVLAATLAFVSSPFWSSGFGGFDPNAYPNPQVDPPAQPAGYAFSIWGLIYLWLVVHAVMGLFARSDAADWDAPRGPLIAALVVGAPWITVAQSDPGIATAMIWIMLGGALGAFVRAPHLRDRWTAAAPLGLFAGWLTAASFVALALLGAGHGVLFGEIGWALAALAGASGTALIIQRRRPDAPEYGIAVGWAFFAVAVANWGALTWLAALAGLAGLAMIGIALRAFRAAQVSA